MNRKNKEKLRRGDHVVIQVYEHGDAVGTITKVKNLVGNVAVLNTKIKTLYGEEVTSFIGQQKNLRLATREEKEYFKRQKKTTCIMKPKRKKK